eukprot:CAMPEP_0176456500 /NCGR_PEP_ID=MMETSP0127-20121128/31325_1 /TAXON_ID=938130 /ORGANISM="Platyophrya macrostoma, Strain WH" /LENGTH=502 /DNA_ID=CAMNT_0017846471 /DNA_START=43 /DNA_END=1551 /DNA_ORIENTATION=+
MSTSEDEYEHGGDDYMELEQVSNEQDDSDFGEDLQNGKFSDDTTKQKLNGKRKLTRPVSARKYYTEEEGAKLSDDDEAHDTREENLLEQLQSERISDIDFFGALTEFGSANGRQSKGKNAMVDERDMRIHYLAPRKIKELEKLTDPQKIELIKKESPELLSVLTDFKKSLKEVKNKFLPLLSYLRNKKFKISEGISYLDVKFELLLSYCMNLAFYILIKLQGKTIKDHPVLRRLVYIKSLLSKLKPLDKKLEYQINKLLRMANQQSLVGENYNRAVDMQQDPLSHAPRPGKIIADVNTEETKEGKKDSSKPGIYKAPKLSATVMEEDKKEAKKKRQEDAKRRKLYMNSFITDLEKEVNQEPEEIFVGNPMKEIEDDYDKEKNQFEEENFTRIPTTRLDRRRLHEKKKKLMSRADDFEEFDKIRDIVRDNFAQEEERRERGKQKLQESIAEYASKRTHRNMKQDDEGPDGVEEGSFRSFKKVKKSQSPGKDFNSKRPKGILRK